MYALSVSRPVVYSILVVLFSVLGPVRSSGAQPASDAHQHPAPPPAAGDAARPSVPPGHGHEGHGASGTSLFSTRDASGTAWLPAASPMYGVAQDAGVWQLMWHGQAFAQVLVDGGPRGRDQAGSINWVMGMARRPLGGGRLGLRAMISLEPLTVPGCGYPDLLATGEVCDGEPIHDRQHPHDLLMEVAAEYDRPLTGSLRWQLYGGLAGEPALGPVAYPHRVSAMPNPLAPISHHWLDATHITFGVVTGGISSERWKAEASLFNGREPDEHRWDLDLAPLDSVAGRVWVAPLPSLVLQVSAGRLREAEQGHAGEPRVDVTRATASATYHRALAGEAFWATTLAWGRNSEEGVASHALLAETSVSFADRHTWFGRFETGGKPAHDLDIHGSDDVFVVSKLQAGYTQYLAAWRGLQAGIGGGLSLSLVPESLERAYGSRAIFGSAFFVTIRPGRHVMH